MALTPEWKTKIEIWKNSLSRLFYSPLGCIDLEGLVSDEPLSLEDAMQKSFSPVHKGMQWGAKWEYRWFRGSVTLPELAKGKRIVARIDTGAESAVYVNGSAAGARDRMHSEITLSKCARSGETFDIHIESYAGHGPRVCDAGPVEPGRQTVPEPPEAQCVIGESTYGAWNEDIYQLWLDVETLYQIRNNIDPNSLRTDKIDEGLRAFVKTVDLELPFDQMLETVRKCRKLLEPLLDCVNGSTVPEMFVFGHSHIDVAWLWPLRETEKKCVRTFSTQLSLMDEYSEYKYLQSQPYLYQVVKSKYPELYKRVKAAVDRGQFMPEGAMWVEADTNISGGEALIRQFIHGKRFLRDEFGVDSRLCWLPDVFGYTGAFPQIMKGCGVDYFSTMKIMWTYNSEPSFPYHTFWWEGIDGTKVLAHIHNDYNSHTRPETIIQRWNTRVQKSGISTRLFPFGYGDGGGGATRDHLEYLRRCKNLEGVPATRMCHPVDFFTDLEKRGVPNANYVGELYFAEHRGTYTSQARTKKWNRRSEIALREAEIWGVAANRSSGFGFDSHTLDEDWKAVLLNQFHDVLPGSSIARVYEDANTGYKKAFDHAQSVVLDSTKSLVTEADALTVFNSLPWDSERIVELPSRFAAVIDAQGRPLVVQEADGARYAMVSVPSCGWSTIYPTKQAVKAENEFEVWQRGIDNGLVRIELNDSGEIVSFYDKQSKRELAAGPCNAFRMYRDVPNGFDAWDIESSHEDMPVTLSSEASIEVTSEGPLFASIRVVRMLNNSKMEQEIVVYRSSKRVDFRTKIDWQESHKLLKVGFPFSVHSNEAIHEIQFGYIKRPNHRSTELDSAKFEVCNHRWTTLAEGKHGCAVLNDSKYGVSVYGNTISLTLLKSALAPDMNADKGAQEFTYSMYAYEGPFEESEVVKEGYLLNCPVTTQVGEAQTASLFRIDEPNIVIETVKPAEDGSGDIVVRMYESMRTSTECTMSVGLPFSTAVETNMLEEDQHEIPVSGNELRLAFRPFEIKTVRLRR